MYIQHVFFLTLKQIVSRVLDISKQDLYSELHIQLRHQANKDMKQTL